MCGEHVISLVRGDKLAGEIADDMLTLVQLTTLEQIPPAHALVLHPHTDTLCRLLHLALCHIASPLDGRHAGCQTVGRLPQRTDGRSIPICRALHGSYLSLYFIRTLPQRTDGRSIPICRALHGSYLSLYFIRTLPYARDGFRYRYILAIHNDRSLFGYLLFHIGHDGLLKGAHVVDVDVPRQTIIRLSQILHGDIHLQVGGLLAADVKAIASYHIVAVGVDISTHCQDGVARRQRFHVEVSADVCRAEHRPYRGLHACKLYHAIDRLVDDAVLRL